VLFCVLFVCKCVLSTQFQLNISSSWRNIPIPPYVCAVGIATRHVLYCAWIQSRNGEIFRSRPYRPWDPPNLVYNGCHIFSGSEAAGAWRWIPISI
jgi:hypothetical protein